MEGELVATVELVHGAQYKNNPKGTRTFENGLYPDTTQTVYLKNYYLGSTPQYCANIGIDYRSL